MVKVDKKDLKLLSILEMDARMPLPQLAKKVGVSRQVAEYRITKLKKEGVITGSKAVYDQKVVGENIYRVLFQLYTLSDEQLQEFIEHLKHNYNLMWFARIGGGWDFIINIMAKDTYHFDTIFMNITDLFGDRIQKYIILSYVNIHDTARKYLSNSTNTTVFFHRMGDERIMLDSTDREIIKILGEDCRLSNIEIGTKVGLTGNAVRYRIRNYIQSKFLLGFRTFINPNTLGYQNFLTFLTINNLKTKDERRLISYLVVHKNITFIVKHIGEFRIGFEIETKDVEELEHALRDLRTNFKDLITDIKIFPVFEEYIVNYSPD